MTNQTAVPVRGDISALPNYVPGKPVEPVDGRSYKLSSNELPWPPDPAVTEAVSHAVTGANRYPTGIGQRLVAALADTLEVPAARIVTGGGSISLVQLLMQALVDPGDAVVFPWRSYEAYPIIVPVCHATPVPVPLVDRRHDLSAMAAAVVRHRARAVLVCSPNNPTGTAITQAELDEFIAKVPAECLVIVDEAYIEFNNDPAKPDGIATALSHPNVAVLRTFSKAYGLAGMRAGYCVAPESVADAMRRVALPFLLSATAEAAAIAALQSWPRQRVRVRDIISRRDEFAAELTTLGLPVPQSRSNFVWLPLGDHTASLVDALRARGISVRAFPGDGVRITIGKTDAMRLTRDTIAQWSREK